MNTPILPAGWPRPKGYSNAIAADGRMVFVAGQIGWDENEAIVSSDFVEQAVQALRNTVTLLAEAGAGPEHIVRMTWYVTSRREYLDSLAGLGAAYRKIIGKNFPVMTAVEISALMEADAKVEIESTAVVG